jgi:NH3-dependent NAD+ synthetase
LGAPKADEIGCDFYIISPEYSYCFWSFANDLDVSYSNREISELLGIPPEVVDKISTAGLQKWKDLKDTPVMIAFKEALQDAISRKDESTIHYPDLLNEIVNKSFMVDLVQTEEAEEESEEKVKPKVKKIKTKKKACAKAQLFGLYSPAALKRLKDKKNGQKSDP